MRARSELDADDLFELNAILGNAALIRFAVANHLLPREKGWIEVRLAIFIANHKLSW